MPVTNPKSKSNSRSKKRTPVKKVDMKIVHSASQSAQPLHHFNIDQIIGQGGKKQELNGGPVDQSLKDNLHGIIVKNEMLQAQDAANKKLANCGDIYYITQEDIYEMKKRMEENRKRRQQMLNDVLFTSALCMTVCFFIGKIFGAQDALDYVEANYDVTPRKK